MHRFECPGPLQTGVLLLANVRVPLHTLQDHAAVGLFFSPPPWLTLGAPRTPETRNPLKPQTPMSAHLLSAGTCINIIKRAAAADR